MLKSSNKKHAHISSLMYFGFMTTRNLWIVFAALPSVQSLSYRHYERVLETCVNSAMSTHTSTHKFQCGQLCEANRPLCSGFCFSEADSTCTLHQIVDMGSGTVELGFRTYKYFNDGTAHNIAFDLCISVGAFLALPKNLEQNNYLLQLSGGKSLFLSMDDVGHEGSWLTSGSQPAHGADQSPTYTNWKSGEPNNGNSNENCLQLTSNGWNDINCANSIARVCQAPRPEICTTLPHPAYPDLRCYKRKQ